MLCSAERDAGEAGVAVMWPGASRSPGSAAGGGFAVPVRVGPPAANAPAAALASGLVRSTSGGFNLVLDERSRAAANA